MRQQGPGIIKRKEDLRRDEINKWSSHKHNTHCENFNIVIAYIIMQAAYSEPYQRSKMECFTKIFNIKAVDYFRKKFHLRTLHGSEYASECSNLLFHLFLIFQNYTTWSKRRCAVNTQQAFSSSPNL